jgi:hypothetical protein
LRRIAPPGPDDDRLDLYLVGEAWWDLVRPLFANVRRARRRRRYTRLRDLDTLLQAQLLDLTTVQDRLRPVPAIVSAANRVPNVAADLGGGSSTHSRGGAVQIWEILR